MVAGVLSGWHKSDEVDVKDRNIWYEDDLNVRKVSLIWSQVFYQVGLSRMKWV